MSDICGVILNKPKISENKDRCTCIIITARGKRDTGDNTRNNVRWDYIVVATKDPEIIEQMETIEAFDIVRMKGVIVTKYLPKEAICENCKNINTREDMFVYFEPIYMERIIHADDEESAKQAILDRREISNEIRVLGVVCNDPSMLLLKSAKVCQYQIAIPRTYRLKGSSDDDKYDYPWVKSYGKNAVEDYKRLKQKSLILIDGCLQAREKKCESTCSHCGVSYSYLDQVLEIVPYEVEYLRNYVTDEELGIVRVEKEIE